MGPGGGLISGGASSTLGEATNEQALREHIMTQHARRRLRQIFAAGLFGIAALSMTSCSDDSSGGGGEVDPVVEPKVDGQITPGGGTVEIEGAMLRAPADALATSVIVEITPLDPPPVAAPDGTSFVSVAYKFAPTATTFDIAVTLRVSYESEATEGLHLIRLDDENDAEWEEVTGLFTRGEAVTTSTQLGILAVTADGPVTCPDTNACGGCDTLDHEPGEACGDCQVYRCDGQEAVTCRSTHACEADQLQCADNQVQQCQQVDGCRAWVTTLDCGDAATCEDGICHEGCANECAAVDDTSCQGTVLATCVEDGDGCLVIQATDTDCEATGQVCDDSSGTAACACPPDICVVDAQRCGDAGIEVCQQGSPCNTWELSTACDTDQTCQDGDPPTCECTTDPCPEVSTTRCNNNAVETCEIPNSLTCAAWTVTDDCGSQTLTCDNTGDPICQ